ncbi:amidase, partial [Streptomyces sp. SID2119]|nr:amidase [Streptomyces sp. SID2119]
MSSAEPTEQTGPAVRSHADRDRVPAPAPMPGLAESARLLADSATTSSALVADALARIEAAQPTLNAFRHLR